MKKILLVTACLAGLVYLISCGGNPTADESSQPDRRYVRKNANSPEAAKDLEAMNVALQKMKELDCSDPRSWYYQGAIHWTPDSIYGKNELCSSFQTHNDLKAAWDNCTHTDSGTEENHFLVWHRLYIWHFEKIVRSLSGYQDFALPYWGYTDTTDTQVNRTMPALFRDNASSLFEAGRLDTLNKGLPISGSVLRKLNIKKLNEHQTYVLFNKNMDAAPHGAMHNYIGFGNDTTGKMLYDRISQTDSYGLMSDVSTAGFDPIFWAHHSNIDRVWQQWTNSERGQNVTREMLDVPWNYEFFDENGKKVTYTIDEVIDILYNLDYDFDDTPVHKKKEPLLKRPVQIAKAQTQDTLGKLIRPVSLNDRLTRVTVGNSKRGGLKLAVTPQDEGHILVLNVTVSFASAPKGSFEVFLNPSSGDLNPDSDSFIGFMTFFGADHTHHHHGHSQPSEGRKTKTFSFDVTEEAHISEATNRNSFELSILKFENNTGSDLRIEKVSVVKH